MWPDPDVQLSGDRVSGAVAAVVKGGGELGTAVALGLWRAGWRVVVAELPRPTVLRRQLSLAEAAFVGSVSREGAHAMRVSATAETLVLLREPAVIPLYVAASAELVDALQPALVVDARMRRGVDPEPQRHEAPLVVGLGPELIAGDHVDFVIETCPGPDLGRVVRDGAARPLVPLPRGPHGSAEEYVRAPTAGLWRTTRAIGDVVGAGDVLGWLDGQPLRAPVAGCVRGLVHDAVTAPPALKLAAVHPGDWRRKEAGIGQRALTVAAGVLSLTWGAAGTPAAARGRQGATLATATP